MIVLNFNSQVSIIKIENNTVIDYFELDTEYTIKELLGDENKLEMFLTHLVKSYEDIKYNTIYITINELEYKTFAVGIDQININGSRTKKKDQIEAIKEMCKIQFSDDNYTSCIMNIYVTDNEYILTVAYIYDDYLSNIIKVFDKLQISVLNIQPSVYLLYQFLRSNDRKPFIFDTENELILITTIGLIIWKKPQQYELDIAEKFLIEQGKSLYNLNIGDSANTITKDDIKDWNIKNNTGIFNDAILIALGVNKVFNVNQVKGDLVDVINKIRIILNRRTNK